MTTGGSEKGWHVFREPQTGLYGRVKSQVGMMYAHSWHLQVTGDPNGQWTTFGEMFPADNAEHAIDRARMKLRDRYIRFQEDVP